MAEGKPVIGITTGTRTNPKSGREFGQVVLNIEYAERIIEAGGVPIVLPPGADGSALAGLIDGLLITGGNDIHASVYGEEHDSHNSLEDPKRLHLERELWSSIPDALPVLGICYGCQFLNVAHGGKLVQHLPDVVGDDRHSGDPVQDYEVVQGTKLAQAINSTQAAGKSSHHQAVGAVGKGLRVTARHEDGTVEALERTDDRWVVGVQWHPERSPGPTTDHLFAAFLNQARSYRKDKDTCGTW